MLSKLEETLVVDGRRFELSANRYPGVVHPRGLPLPARVPPRSLPRLRSTKSTAWSSKSASSWCTARTPRSSSTSLRLAMPALWSAPADRLPRLPRHHPRQRRARSRDGRSSPGVVTLAPYPGLPPLYLAHGARRRSDPATAGTRNFEFDLERERGLDFQEDLFNPLVLTFSSRPASASRRDRLHRAPRRRRRRRAPRRRDRPPAAMRGRPLVRRTAGAALAAAADQFIVKRGDCKTIIAGYHWFSDWGRDTMIALPGLTLATGRYDVARQILLAFAAQHGSRHAPQSLPRCRRDPRVQHRGRHPVVLRSRSRLRRATPATTRSCAESLSEAEGHHRLAPARHPLRHPRGRRRPALPAASRACN